MSGQDGRGPTVTLLAHLHTPLLEMSRSDGRYIPVLFLAILIVRYSDKQTT